MAVLSVGRLSCSILIALTIFITTWIHSMLYTSWLICNSPIGQVRNREVEGLAHGLT